MPAVHLHHADLLSAAAGRYFGSAAAAEGKLPFPAGFEAVGVVAAAAPDVQVRSRSAAGHANALLR